MNSKTYNTHQTIVLPVLFNLRKKILLAEKNLPSRQAKQSYAITKVLDVVVPAFDDFFESTPLNDYFRRLYLTINHIKLEGNPDCSEINLAIASECPKYKLICTFRALEEDFLLLQESLLKQGLIY